MKPGKSGTALADHTPLLPDRLRQPDLFICDIFDAVPKSDMGGMEFPLFSISKKPDFTPRRFESAGRVIEVAPSAAGIATVFDRDILIYCISQLVAGLNAGRPACRTVAFRISDYLAATGKPVGGSAYVRAEAALERLRGTTITTNFRADGLEVWQVFGLIERARTVRRSSDGALREVQVTLSDWIWQAIEAREVLTISRDYFRLRKPLERRLYEIARKHCGAARSWRIGLPRLREKCGSGSSAKEFRRLVGAIAAADAAHGHLPDYRIRLSGETVEFTSRGSVPCPAESFRAVLDPAAFEEARAAAPGWDVHMLEAEWRSWCGREEVTPRSPSRHFVRFCESWYARRGRA